jgi:hypothetical protein
VKRYVDSARSELANCAKVDKSLPAPLGPVKSFQLVAKTTLHLGQRISVMLVRSTSEGEI